MVKMHLYKTFMKLLFSSHIIKPIGEITMNSKTTSKKDIYKAIGYTVVLVGLAIPFSILGMQALNFVLGNIRV
jgi:hypothetical protein